MINYQSLNLKLQVLLDYLIKYVKFQKNLFNNQLVPWGLTINIPKFNLLLLSMVLK